MFTRLETIGITLIAIGVTCIYHAGKKFTEQETAEAWHGAINNTASDLTIADETDKARINGFGFGSGR